MIISYADIARAFFKEHGVYKYRMKKVSEMTDNEVCQYCHWFYEENRLTQEWRAFLRKFETDYCHCPFLHDFIDIGMCYDLQMIAFGYIKATALPELEIDYDKLQLSCANCIHYCEASNG